MTERSEFPVRLLITGDETFSDYGFLSRKLRVLLQQTPVEDIQLIYGGAVGAETLRIIWAVNMRCPGLCTRDDMDWDYTQRIAAATHCVVFIAGASERSDRVILAAESSGIKLRVIELIEPVVNESNLQRSVHGES